MSRRFTGSIPREGAKRMAAANASLAAAAPPMPSEHNVRTVCGETFTEFQSLTHWSPGSTYYFSDAEMDRLHPPGSVNAQHRRIIGGTVGSSIARSNTSGVGGVTATQNADEASSNTTAVIHGAVGSYTIDLTIPLLRKEELERWELEAYLHRRGFNTSGMLARSRRHVHTLLPPDAPVTYLGDEVHRMDQALRHRGYFTISEVAEVFVPLVPTFPVETRFVFAQLPPHLHRKVEGACPAGTSIAMGLFARYPQVFQFLPSRFRRSLVQLNPTNWFIRQHPGYGKANRALQQYRVFSEGQDLSTSSYLAPNADGKSEDSKGGAQHRQSWRARLLGILASHLPRKATPTASPANPGSEPGLAERDSLSGAVYVKERYASHNLVQWISSFPARELDFINKMAELEALHFIAQHVYIFQLMSLERGDHNLFVEASVFLAGMDQAAKPAGSGSAVRDAAEADGEDEEREEGTWWTAQSEGAPAEGSGVAAGDADAGEEDLPAAPAAAAAPAASSPVALQRERSFKQAVADELIGLDELAADVDGEEGDEAASMGPDSDFDAPPRDYDGDDDGDGDGDGESHAASAERQEWVRAASRQRQQEECRANGRGRQAAGSDAEETTAFGLPLEKIYIRRLPPDVAPRSLSDLDHNNSPDPELVKFAASFLGSPRSMSGRNLRCFFRETRRAYKVPVTDLTEIWRWVPVERIYSALTTEQRQYLRLRYKGLVNFLRYHGKVFEVSSDYRLVIAHDPEGTLAPVPHLQRNFDFRHRVVLPPDFDDNPNVSVELLGESARKVFARVLGEGSIPTCRRHVLLIDPDNPMMIHHVLYDEIANLTPEQPILMRELLLNMPPLMRACLPNIVNLASCKRLETYVEKSNSMVRRRERLDFNRLAAKEKAEELMSAEEAVAELLQVPFGSEGMTIRAAIRGHLSRAAVDSLADHFGSVTRALRMLPQYFQITDLSDGRKRLLLVRRKQ